MGISFSKKPHVPRATPNKTTCSKNYIVKLIHSGDSGAELQSTPKLTLGLKGSIVNLAYESYEARFFACSNTF